MITCYYPFNVKCADLTTIFIAMRTVIIANLTPNQLAYIRNLASEQGIEAEFIVQQEEAEQRVPSSTPITGAMLEEIAQEMGKTVIEVATLAAQYGVETVEEALAHSDVPPAVKQILESYL